MTALKKIFRQINKFKILFLSLILLLVITLYWQSALKFENITVTDKSGKQQKISLPYKSNSEPNEIIKFNFTIKAGLFSNRWIRIIPDDCIQEIKINNISVPLDVNVDRCNWQDGFYINIGKYLKKGCNPVEITLLNAGGIYGIDIYNSSKKGLADTSYIILIVLIFFIGYFVCDSLFHNKYISIFYSIGLIISISYFFETPFFIRGHDVSGHIDYIRYIVTNHKLPESEAGSEFYHPPLYYIIAAIYYNYIRIIGLPIYYAYHALQLLSLLFFQGFILTSIKIFKLLLIDDNNSAHSESDGIGIKKTVFILLSAMVIFWPSGIIHSVRIGNDCLMYFLFSLSVFYLIKWYKIDANKFLYLSSFYAALAIITKTNALLVAGLVILSIFIKYIFTDKKNKYNIAFLKKSGIVFIILISGILIAIGPSLQKYFFSNDKNHILVKNSHGLPKELEVGNEIKNFINFDTYTFAYKPYTNAYDDNLGRQYFWNYLFKTSLFGEFSFNRITNNNTLKEEPNFTLAKIVSFSFLFLLIIVVIGLGYAIIHRKENFVMILLFFLLLAGALLFKQSIPKSCSNDFRYIFPFIIPFIYFFGLSIMFFKRKKYYFLYYSSWVCAILFIFSNFLFFFFLTI